MTTRRRAQSVAMVTTLAGPGSVAGGVWEVVANQASALMDAGVSVRVVAGWLGADPPRQVRDIPMTLVPLRQAVPGLGLRALVGRGWAAAVSSALDGADLAHIHLCRDLLTTSATHVAHRARVPVIAQTHGMLTPPRSTVFRGFDVAITHPALRSVSHFVALTDTERAELARFGVTAARVTTVPNAVPEPHVEWRPSDGPRRLLFASRLHPRKQVMVFAETVARLRRDGHDVTGVVAGPDQGDLTKLKQFIRTGDHSRYLTYLGELGREPLQAEMSTATAFVFPARDEPFGLVLLEALSVGTPTVTTDQTPLAVSLRDHGAAAVCPPEPESLARELSRVITDDGFRSSISRRGRALYEQRWTTSIMVNRLQDVYEAARWNKGRGS